MSMLTRNSWVKIALVALLCLVVCGGLVSCNRGCTSAVNHATSLGSSLYADYELPNVGGGTVAAQDVQDLEIDWAAGSVAVEVVPDAEADGMVVIEEPASGQVPDQERVRWGMVGQKLVVASGYERRGLCLWGCSLNAAQTQLTLRLPESTARALGTMALNAASGRYTLGPIGCEQLRISLASGHVEGEGLQASDLQMQVASGKVDLSGTFADQMTLDQASGNVAIACEGRCPSRSKIDLASGNVQLQLPEDVGFSVDVDRTSGSFDYAFSDSAKQSGSAYVHGDGTGRISVNMLSGSMTLAPLPSVAAAGGAGSATLQESRIAK